MLQIFPPFFQTSLAPILPTEITTEVSSPIFFLFHSSAKQASSTTMGCLISCLACQAVSCCTGLACSCCGKVIPCSKSIATRGMYVFLFFLSAVVQYVLNTWSYKLFTWIPGTLSVTRRSNALTLPQNSTFAPMTMNGVWVRFRLLVSHLPFRYPSMNFPSNAIPLSIFVLNPKYVFHLIMAILMIRVKNSSDFRASIQDGFWLIKIGAIVGLTVVAYLIPTPFFVVFGMRFANLFLLSNILFRMDLALWCCSLYFNPIDVANWTCLFLVTPFPFYARTLDWFWLHPQGWKLARQVRGWRKQDLVRFIK